MASPSDWVEPRDNDYLPRTQREVAALLSRHLDVLPAAEIAEWLIEQWRTITPGPNNPHIRRVADVASKIGQQLENCPKTPTQLREIAAWFLAALEFAGARFLADGGDAAYGRGAPEGSPSLVPSWLPTPYRIALDAAAEKFAQRLERNTTPEMMNERRDTLSASLSEFMQSGARYPENRASFFIRRIQRHLGPALSLRIFDLVALDAATSPQEPRWCRIFWTDALKELTTPGVDPSRSAIATAQSVFELATSIRDRGVLCIQGRIRRSRNALMNVVQSAFERRSVLALHELLSIYLFAFRVTKLELSEEVRLFARDTAQQSLDHFRRRLRDDDHGRPLLETIESFRDAVTWPSDTLRVVEGQGRALRALLLAFRELRVAGVAEDLRDWQEPPYDDPPKPWFRVSQRISTFIHQLIEDEDEGLVQVREAFATLCLERLTSGEGKKSKATTPREPDPLWRYGYLRAFEDLEVNPRGQAQKTLHWVHVHDPDERVRERAADAARRLHKSPELSSGRSPKRALLAAFWHLRQAHLKALGARVDADGAQRTRDKEAQYTTRPIH